MKMKLHTPTTHGFLPSPVHHQVRDMYAHFQKRGRPGSALSVTESKHGDTDLESQHMEEKAGGS